jgi:hypothetical protein
VIDLFKAFVDIALWRKGPQHLPASVLLLLIVVVLSGVLSLVFRPTLDPPEQHLTLLVVLEIGISLAWIWLLLAAFRRPERFVQTATAIFGTGVLLTPLLFGIRTALESMEKTSPLLVPVLLGLLTLLVWYLLINAHILRAALEVNLFVAILLTVLGTGFVLVVATRVLSLATQAA